MHKPLYNKDICTWALRYYTNHRLDNTKVTIVSRNQIMWLSVLDDLICFICDILLFLYSVFCIHIDVFVFQWYQQSYWHSMVHMQQVYSQPVVDAQFQPYSSTVPTADHTVPQAYSDPVRMCPHPQGDVPSNGKASLPQNSTFPAYKYILKCKTSTLFYTVLSRAALH